MSLTADIAVSVPARRRDNGRDVVLAGDAAGVVDLSG